MPLSISRLFRRSSHQDERPEQRPRQALQRASSTATNSSSYIPRHAARDALLSVRFAHTSSGKDKEPPEDPDDASIESSTLVRHPNVKLMHQTLSSCNRSVSSSTLPTLSETETPDEALPVRRWKGKGRAYSADDVADPDELHAALNEAQVASRAHSVAMNYPKEYFGHDHVPKRASNRLDRRAMAQAAQRRLSVTQCSSATQSSQSFAGSSVAGQCEASSSSSIFTACADAYGESSRSHGESSKSHDNEYDQ